MGVFTSSRCSLVQGTQPAAFAPRWETLIMLLWITEVCARTWPLVFPKILVKKKKKIKQKSNNNIPLQWNRSDMHPWRHAYVCTQQVTTALEVCFLQVNNKMKTYLDLFPWADHLYSYKDDLLLKKIKNRLIMHDHTHTHTHTCLLIHPTHAHTPPHAHTQYICVVGYLSDFLGLVCVLNRHVQNVCTCVCVGMLVCTCACVCVCVCACVCAQWLSWWMVCYCTHSVVVCLLNRLGTL